MNFSYPFIRRPVGTTLLAIGLFLVGAVAYQFLPVASVPTVDFPTIRVSASRPGADPRDHGGDGRGAARAPARRDRRRHRNHLAAARSAKPRSPCSSISAATSTAPRATCRPRINAAPSDLPSDLPQLPTFRKVNPAAAPILILALTSKTIPPSAIYDAADTVVAQRIMQVDGVADVTVSGAEQPAIRMRVNPVLRSPRPASRSTTCASRSSHTNAQGPLGEFDGAQRGDHRDQRSAAHRRRLSARWSSRPVNGNVVRCPTSPAIVQGTRNTNSAAWYNLQPAVLLIITKQTNANVIDTVDHIRELLPEIKRWIPAGIDISVLSDRTQTIRASVHDMQCDARRHGRAGDAGRVPVPAARRADDRRRRHRAAVARRHLRRDVAGRLFDRQSVADGARGLGRLRRRRRHRHDREHLPQPGKGPLAAARGDRRRAADRLHGRLDQHFADRGVHSAAVHGRHRRPAVPRILRHARVRDRDLDGGVADRHADDLRAFHPRNPERGQARASIAWSKACWRG